jgi:hypothetical protein
MQWETQKKAPGGPAWLMTIIWVYVFWNLWRALGWPFIIGVAAPPVLAWLALTAIDYVSDRWAADARDDQ